MSPITRRTILAGVTAAVALATPFAITPPSESGTAEYSRPVPASAPAAAPAAPTVARNVIFIQGDGLGTAHREFLRLVLAGRKGELWMNSLPVAGLVHTSSADRKAAVTDSAAAATAFATGAKTFNGGVGVDSKGRRVTSVLEVARQAGKSTGLVTTAQVTDATPAAFGAHVSDRDAQSSIASQYLERTRPEVILGGGEDYWYPRGKSGAYRDRPAKDRSEKSKGTRGNLVTRARQLGYDYVTTAAGLKASKASRVLGLFANEEMFEQRRDGKGSYAPVVSLADMTRKGLDVLDGNPKGFFLLVEEEAIDEMAHHNNARLLLKAGRALERAVAVALDFQKRHPDTLIIVAGDHETGGLTIENVQRGDGSGSGDSREDGPFKVKGTSLKFTVDWTSKGHTGADTPITAGGPGAEAFGGVIENTEVFTAMVRAMGLR